MKHIQKISLSLLVCTLAIAILSAFSVHKYYVGVTEVHHNKAEKTLEIAVKLFTDDLEKALEESGETERLYLGEKNENSLVDQAISAYLSRNFFIEVNGKPTNWNFIGKEADIEACWSYLLVENVKKIKSIEITNKCLTEIFNKQSHMVSVYAGDEKQSKLLTSTKSSEKFSF